MINRRLYLDNNIITLIKDIFFNKPICNNVHLLLEQASLTYISKIKSISIEILLSEESLAEINMLPKESLKKIELKAVYYAFKKAKPVIRNSVILFDDPITTMVSPDVFFDHPYDDIDLNKVRKYLRSVGNNNDFDARYIANAMLPLNKIDAFITYDKKSLWNHKTDIRRLFGVYVKLPSEEAEYLKYIS